MAGDRSGERPYKKSTPQQQMTGYAAMLFSIITLILVVYFCHGPIGKNMLGGFNFGDLIFNWHPVLMVSAFNFCSIYALVSTNTCKWSPC
jgi:hypothetical protein